MPGNPKTSRSLPSFDYRIYHKEGNKVPNLEHTNFTMAKQAVDDEKKLWWKINCHMKGSDI